MAHGASAGTARYSIDGSATESLFGRKVNISMSFVETLSKAQLLKAFFKDEMWLLRLRDCGGLFVLCVTYQEMLAHTGWVMSDLPRSIRPIPTACWP
jgi:hypothetical protein